MNLLVLLLLIITFCSPKCAHQEAGLLKWSDPKTWPNQRVPTENTIVTISPGMKVLLDQSTPNLRGVRIEKNGLLVFNPSNETIELKTEFLVVYGTLKIGENECPYNGTRAIITLITPANQSENIDGQFGSKVLGVGKDGTLELHGEVKTPSWTILSETVNKGEKTIRLANPVNWKIGDSIVIASTDFDEEQTEVRIITGMNEERNILSLDEPLRYSHFGGSPNPIDERAEVALLTRNILIRGDDAPDHFGGHVMVLSGFNKVNISATEFYRLGQEGIMARYPLHFHHSGDVKDKLFITDTSLHQNFQRCITLHGTNGAFVKNNVAYDTIGHCYFLEDGIEKNNILENNIALVVKTGYLLPSDSTPAAFYVSHPSNVLKNNVAVGAYIGFWITKPDLNHEGHENHDSGHDSHCSGAHCHENQQIHHTNHHIVHHQQSKLVFVNNTVHSSWEGLIVDLCEMDHDISSKNLSHFTAYKIRNRGMWFTGGDLQFEKFRFSDCRVGSTIESKCFPHKAPTIQDFLYIAESINQGTPKLGDPTSPRGNTIPTPWNATASIVGLEYFANQGNLNNVTFSGYIPDGLRMLSCFGMRDVEEKNVNVENVSCDFPQLTVCIQDNLCTFEM